MQDQRNIRNILVTGGAGFIGFGFYPLPFIFFKHVSMEICVNLDALTYAGNLANLKSVVDDSRYIFVKGNVWSAVSN